MHDFFQSGDFNIFNLVVIKLFYFLNILVTNNITLNFDQVFFLKQNFI